MATLQQMPQQLQDQATSPREASDLKLHSPRSKLVLSSPVSSCSVSTRLPDSDSEEWLLDTKSRSDSFSSEDSPDSSSDTQNFLAETPPLVVEEPHRIKLRASSLGNALETDLAWFRRCAQVEFKPWTGGEFTTVRRLAKSVLGEVNYLNTKEGTGVVAKVMPTDKVISCRSTATDERLAWLSTGEVPTVEDPWNEIAVLTFLQRSAEQCGFLLKLLGVFQDRTSTYVITEYCDGGELFELVAYGDRLSAEEIRRYVSQLLRAVQYLHGHCVGHRDISLENVLLRQGTCVLMDFGQAVRIRSLEGVEFRYFAEAGKRMYRAPEMYVPRERTIQVVCPSDAIPGTVVQISYDRCRCEVLLPTDASPGVPCRAEPYGYAVAPADLFACGVCAFVLAIGKPPWNVARDLDPTFSFIRRHGMPALLRQWRSGLQAVREEDSLLTALLRVNPKQRPSLEECLRNPWLCASSGDDVSCGESRTKRTTTS